MKATIPARDLGQILAHKNVVEKRNTIPILANVLLRAHDNRLTARMTDLDMMVTANIACEVKKSGSTTVPAHMIADIVSKFTKDKAKADQPITLDLEEPNLTLKGARSRFKIQTLPESDFPDLSLRDAKHKFEIPAADLEKLLLRANFCISTEEARYYLNGIYLHHHHEGKVITLRGVATDGHRLARIECAAPTGADMFGNSDNKDGIIIPRKTCGLLTKIISENKIDKVGIELSDTKIVFSLGHITVMTKLVNGTFPDYVRVVPVGNDKIMRADRKELLETVDRITAIVSERGRVARLSLSHNKLECAVINADAGSAIEEIDVDYDGEPLQIGFNSHYVVDVLNNVEGDKVEFRLADPGSPTLVQGVDSADALFVLMPMRV